MAKVVKNQGKPLYPVHCTECGREIEQKFFAMRELLKQYTPPRTGSEDVAKLVEFLGIGAVYGQAVLPEVPGFLVDGKWNFEKPVISAKATLAEFCCADTQIPENQLREVNLNIASIIAQFCVTTGFDDIYPMLALRREMDEADDSFAEVSEEQKSKWKEYCEKLSWVPGVKTDALSNLETRIQDIGEKISLICKLAEREAKEPERRHFAAQKMLAGWRYREENGRKMPYALVARGGLNGSFDTRECCCDKCRRPQVWQMGAYPQKIIGILGTQAVGKTSYLMALADCIPGLKFEKMTIHHDSLDPQRSRIEEAGGLLWRYQHGFPPVKTEVMAGKAPALTFLVKRDADAETVMYTLADIPGEAFDVKQTENFSQQMIDEINRLLKASDSLILMLNKKYLRESTKQISAEVAEQDAEEKAMRAKDPTEVLTYLSDYLSHPLPVAVVLTAADQLGDLRDLLGVAYDPRKLQPLVHSGKAAKYVYNAEMMKAASEAVEDYVDQAFGGFMHNLREGRVPKGSAVSAFLTSSGTQCASKKNLDLVNLDPVESERNYRGMQDARFGVAAPLLWLLSRDGLLDKGRGDEFFNGYEDKVRWRILNEID